MEERFRWGRLVDYLRHLMDGYSGAPGAHAETHLVGGSDPLSNPTGLPEIVSFDLSERSAGTGPSFMRENAQLVVRADDAQDVIAKMVYGQ